MLFLRQHYFFAPSCRLPFEELFYLLARRIGHEDIRFGSSYMWIMWMLVSENLLKVIPSGYVVIVSILLLCPLLPSELIYSLKTG